MHTKEIKVPNYEQVLEAELAPGVTSIIAIHNTKLGPALGGCRFYHYKSKKNALTDVLRLSEGMSFKSALAGLPLGGGKAVIMGDPKKIKTDALLEAFGEFVDSFNGKYITAKDVGIEVEDLDVIARKTRHVRGTSDVKSTGDPSPVTAFGVYQGIRAAAQFRWGNPSLKGKTIIIQGLGHVGVETAKHLLEEGAIVLGTDIAKNKVEWAKNAYGIQPIGPDQWLTKKADIFCPCALGGVVNSKSIPRLKANGVQIVAGGANNQLLEPVEDGKRLVDAKILYAPDFVINAGGVINICYCEILGQTSKEALNKTLHIFDTTLTILKRAALEHEPTSVVAIQMAKERLGLV